MKHISRIIIALLLIAMVLPMAVSCANTDQPSETTLPPETATPSGDAQTTEPEDTLFAPSDIPSDLRFDGETVKILYWDDVPNVEFFVEDQNGEAVNDAIYRRNLNVEAQFGITLEYSGTPGDNGDQANFVSACINSTQAGTDAYDVFAGYSMTGATVATHGIVHDLTEYDIMEFDKPWWPKSLIDKATVNGGVYFASGDISTNYLYMMYMCAFNKDMLNDVHQIAPSVLYDHVYEGEWTLDKFVEYTKGVYNDQDGDGKATEADRYGMTATLVHWDAFFTGSDLKTVELNSDGELEMSADLFSQKTVDLLEKVCNLFYVSGDAEIEKGVTLFAPGNSLFLIERAFITSSKLSDTDFSYGILPTPKFDANQEGYRTCLSFPYTMYMVSTASSIPETAAATIELMAYQSYLHVTPALFEESMKLRYADQSDDAFMFDYIRDAVVIDVGRLFTTELDKMSYSIFRDAIKKNSPGGYLGTQKAYDRTFKNNIDDINESLKKLK